MIIYQGRELQKNCYKIILCILAISLNFIFIQESNVGMLASSLRLITVAYPQQLGHTSACAFVRKSVRCLQLFSSPFPVAPSNATSDRWPKELVSSFACSGMELRTGPGPRPRRGSMHRPMILIPILNLQQHSVRQRCNCAAASCILPASGILCNFFSFFFQLQPLSAFVLFPLGLQLFYLLLSCSE